MLFYQTFVLALATVAPVLALPALRRDEALAIAADSALLNHKQQDAAYKMRANLQKWRDEMYVSRTDFLAGVMVLIVRFHPRLVLCWIPRAKRRQ